MTQFSTRSCARLSFALDDRPDEGGRERMRGASREILKPRERGHWVPSFEGRESTKVNDPYDSNVAHPDSVDPSE